MSKVTIPIIPPQPNQNIPKLMQSSHASFLSFELTEGEAKISFQIAAAYGTVHCLACSELSYETIWIIEEHPEDEGSG